ncbi:MAG: hypothetical protein EPN26_07435, partial [Rhodospirillales bacterium]
MNFCLFKPTRFGYTLRSYSFDGRIGVWAGGYLRCSGFLPKHHRVKRACRHGSRADPKDQALDRGKQMAHSTTAAPSGSSQDESRRDFLLIATSAVGAVG